jgi:hypothetical protein
LVEAWPEAEFVPEALAQLPWLRAIPDSLAGGFPTIEQIEAESGGAAGGDEPGGEDGRGG